MVDSSGVDVLVAGGGIAAAATAIRLRASGLRVVMMVRNLRPVAGIEAVPRRALDLFDVLGEPDVAAEAGAVDVDGPAHAWHQHDGRVPAPFVHVDRAVLAANLMSRAVGRGATLQRVQRLPRPSAVPAGVVALVDGTGRAAAWSRPVRRRDAVVAWQFRGPPADNMAARIVRGDGWWAYRIGHTEACWLAVVTAGEKPPDDVVGTAARRLGLSPASLVAHGCRPAWVQRATQPVSGRRIAVGDAALAHDPISGQGIRFALGSAIAAATAVVTWAGDPSRCEVAGEYYRGLVDAEDTRHRTMLDRLESGDGITETGGPTTSPAVVRFGTIVVQTPLSIDGHVERGPALRLTDGATARWLGTFDLMHLARLAADPTPRLLLVARLTELGLEVGTARDVVSWALRKGVLIDATDAGSRDRR